MGKGSTRRPAAISAAEMKRRWLLTFGKPRRKSQTQRELDRIVHPNGVRTSVLIGLSGPYLQVTHIPSPRGK